MTLSIRLPSHSLPLNLPGMQVPGGKVGSDILMAVLPPPPNASATRQATVVPPSQGTASRAILRGLGKRSLDYL